MKNKKVVILLVMVFIVFVIGVVFFVFRKEKNNNIIINNAETTVEQRIEWNSFLNSNPYLAQMKNIAEYITEQDLLKLAITSENVETEYIVTEEINQNPLLTLGDGYKKSKSNINEYLKSILGKEELAYNFIETYAEEDNYLLVDNDYIYFTKIKLPEKIYVAVKYDEKDEKFEVQIYEYDVSDSNRKKLTEILNTGNINKEIETTNKYILTGQIENEDVKINKKISL